MNDFKTLYKAGRVKRFHTTDVPAQELGQHSWGVAMIVYAIYPKGEGFPEVPNRLMMAALTHDLAETETGDIPAPAKWANPKLDKLLGRLEKDFNERMGIDQFFKDLSAKEKHILAWADMFELCLYSMKHALVDNQDALKISRNGFEALSDMGFPTTESEALYEHFFR